MEIEVRGVVHVGAHRGEELNEYIALGAEKIVWVEGNPDVFLELEDNIEKCTSRIENLAFNRVCTDKDNELIEFWVLEGPDADYQSGNKGCSSVLKPLGKFIGWYKEKLMVESITVDTLLRQNNLNFQDYNMLALDVQGAELLVLKGSKELLKNVDRINVEVTWKNPDYKDNVMFSEIQDYLNNNGFSLDSLKEVTGSWGDAVFVKD